MELTSTCCFTGHRPAKLPWKTNEQDPRCLALKASMVREIEGLYARGFRHFISGMALGCDLYFAEAALSLRSRLPSLTVECALPFPGQADRWSRASRARWLAAVEACDLETVVQQDYDCACMFRRDRYMVDRSALVLAVFGDSAGGTKYTLDYAAQKHREILLLDLNRPEAAAVRMESGAAPQPGPDGP